MVQRRNKIGRVKQKIQYDKNTKLVMFSEGDYIYLKEMTVGVRKSKKFHNKWRGPYLITRRFSDLNYQIQLKPGKFTTVNVNRMKKCHRLPGKVKDIKKKASVTPERDFSDDDWNDSDNEPLHLLGRPKQIPFLPGEIQNSRNNSTGETPVNDGLTQIHVEIPMAPSQEGRNEEDSSVEIIETTDTSQTQEPMEGENINNNQGQPYPYSLRPLLGRWNYNPAESAND